MKKFIKSKKIKDYQVLTPDGWVDIKAIHKTIKYDVYCLKTEFNELYCADDHIIITKDNIEILVKNLNINDEIKTFNGIEKVISINKINKKENMYDLELDENSKKVYFTNNILSHNTSFIRLLAGKLQRDIIFVSPDMVNYITDPGFIPFLMNNSNAILIIEDAEPVLQKRDGRNRTSAISNILNLTDGLLSDCLNISIVATFNTSTSVLDDALLRKGRLITSYTFKKLSIEKSNKLLKKLGHNIEVKKEMSLADIYFYNSDNNVIEEKDKKIGFK
jgi:hypothetical protein